MIRINLLPRERARRRGVGPKALVPGLVVVVIAALVAYTVILNNRNARLRAQVNEVNQQIEAQRPRVARVDELRRQIEAARRKEQLLKSLEASRVPWDRVLEELRTVMPQDVWLVQVELKDSGALVFNGYGMSYEAVARFMVSLESSTLFNSVDLLFSQKQTVAGREVVNFSLTSALTLERKGARVP